MFERFTEKARRVIFFARYEASNYGSPYIETEHLLLGLLREDRLLTTMFLNPRYVREQLRADVERHITRREPIATSVDIPLTPECKEVLYLAVEESERLGVRDIGTEHLLLGMLGVERSLACQLLHERGLTAAGMRAQLENKSDNNKPGTL